MGLALKIIPPGMSFPQALRLGYAGEIRMPKYLEWIREQDCHNCLAPAPSQASHANFYKSQTRKAPDPLTLPECHDCHSAYERNGFTDEEKRLSIAAMYMLQAIYEGRLVWKR